MTDSALYGAIEAGGTKIICLIGKGPDDIRAQIELPTRRPDETIPDILAFFEGYHSQLGPLARVGLASFGPVDINPHSPHWGHVLKTPKPAGPAPIWPVRSRPGWGCRWFSILM
ncbi:hypothetical protein JCM17846_03750 [Iodidimonas nitroreducens]|uniref:ROK family protein n=1 Tax=Iodidimonas nitroreducens TaxID=1236968 RepID=A0A5A7N349_9PROT|nr:hypothetical protein JCM17846_03750 [Iodidimonas nitroreducens]